MTMVILEKLKACGFEEKQLLYNKSPNCCFCRTLKGDIPLSHSCPQGDGGALGGRGFALDFQSVSDFWQPFQRQRVRWISIQQ